jgi:hypothetical protein
MIQTLVGTVYLIVNTEAKISYVGETFRPFQTRLSEHLSQKVESAGWFFNRAVREFEPSVWESSELHIITVDILDPSLKEEAKIQLKQRLLELEIEEIRIRDPMFLYNINQRGRYPCDCCQFSSGTDTGLAIHKFLQHQAEPWTNCQECLRRVLLAKEQTSSQRQHTGFGLWCSSCWLEFKHLFFQHKCHLCDLEFLWAHGLEKHMDRQHSCLLNEEQKLLYDRLFNFSLRSRQDTKKLRMDHSKLWIECGRQVAGKCIPQTFAGIFYF